MTPAEPSAGSRAPRIVLVGLGPHAKRIYLHFLRTSGPTPSLVVDLESRRDEVAAALREAGLDIPVLLLPDEDRDADTLPPQFQNELRRRLAELAITHAIVSTEPKAHYAYLTFFLAEQISILTDKPITAPKQVANSPARARLIEQQYLTLAGLYAEARRRGEISFQVQCQRRWHAGYRYVRELIRDCVQNHGVPMTSIEVYHCDGMWNMPDEFHLRENHPYKYGYGKLFHSGYHFIDLMTWFTELNDDLVDKRADSVELYSADVRPADSFGQLGDREYRTLLGTDRFAEYLDESAPASARGLGELDVYALLQFRRAGRTMTTASLNLLQSGFSRRSWSALPQDTYKGNGRVRHERLNIQVGPLLNVQVHSYQAAEIRDWSRYSGGEVGDIEHFDIHVFRNVELCPGPAYEKVPLRLLAEENAEGFLGFNEQAREVSLRQFLSSDKSVSDLLDHALSVRVLSNTYLSMSRRATGASPVVEFGL